MSAIEKNMMVENSTTRPLNFVELQTAFGVALEEAFEKRDSQILLDVFKSLTANTDHDKKSPLDHAFREMLLFKFYDSVENIGALVKLSVEAVRAEIVSVTIPVVLLGDIFDTITLDKCESIFHFVEDMVEVWKEEIFFSSCKNNILRMCNDLLRRLSRAQNTVFCGRILLFLSKFFPFSERSGLNIVSEFNVDNVTEYGIDGKDLDDTLEDPIEEIPVKIDYNLYCKFWSLQDFFRNPNQCYSKAQWKMFQLHATTVLEAFSSFTLEELRTNTTSNTLSNNNGDENTDEYETNSMMVDTPALEAQIKQAASKTDHFFAKFLTNPKLLTLQLCDSNFRRSVLLQFLILFQYLQMPVKFKSDSNILSAEQTTFIQETESSVYKLLEETPPNGKRFARTMKHMLEREIMWNNWKNEGCKDFKKPVDLETSVDIEKDNKQAGKPPPAKRPKRPFGDSLRDASRTGRFYLGNDVLTRLWNYSPDNLASCKSEERNFLPQLDVFLESPHERGDPSFEWRALRLLARQSPHFFTFVTSLSYKTCDYLESVRRKLARERVEISTTNVSNSGNSTITGNGVTADSQMDNEQEEPDTEQEPGDVLEEEEEPADLDKADEVTNAHAKPMTATREHLDEIAPLIGDQWKRLGKKLGFTTDELLFFETENTTTGGRHDACIAMLSNWFADDDDASLDNWAYILEGLEINEAAKAVKALIERLTSSKTETVEVLSD